MLASLLRAMVGNLIGGVLRGSTYLRCCLRAPRDRRYLDLGLVQLQFGLGWFPAHHSPGGLRGRWIGLGNAVERLHFLGSGSVVIQDGLYFPQLEMFWRVNLEQLPRVLQPLAQPPPEQIQIETIKGVVDHDP